MAGTIATDHLTKMITIEQFVGIAPPHSLNFWQNHRISGTEVNPAHCRISLKRFDNVFHNRAHTRKARHLLAELRQMRFHSESP